MTDGIMRSVLGAQQGAVGVEQKPHETAHVRVKENYHKGEFLQWSACVLLMEGFSTCWEIYIATVNSQAFG